MTPQHLAGTASRTRAPWRWGTEPPQKRRSQNGWAHHIAHGALKFCSAESTMRRNIQAPLIHT